MTATRSPRIPACPCPVVNGCDDSVSETPCRSVTNNANFDVIIQLKNWKKCLTRFFCIFSDFKEDCLPT
ncbi:MAG: hypothetical protein KZQ66_18690, partial [Candidatus Thiodiazotropha sp. (ex Lucinoma aequizonata)]|nr:hypothetical protein [Candidatus Thiodiazotropha sp. (ex Lucinoma aequizonata)]MCU7903755.1 hypothetical protein [Candidatus Thiodiazotropha sp. (ex Lucinoma aequizonata)]MCU7908113.1 hypothetical protein [Candidatus Thiodiazotropha sp. (ex Lucinoma aequizonata)]MCU7913546.1 hypothetical protein [Candidatus Thiodiazotropha sp. (ex Lucinoma aequizonata)]